METIKREDVLEYVNDYIVKNRIADSYKELKLFCAVEGINATKQQIKSFLQSKAKEEGVDLLDTDENTVLDLVDADENLIRRSAERKAQLIKVEKYKYHREDLQHFNNLFRIYTMKCLKICNIISMIRGKRLLDKDLIADLDITINAKEVLLSDIDRLLVPLVHNYSLALDTKFNAEQMSTYINLNINRNMRNGEWCDSEQKLPSTDLQDYFDLSADKKQFIALTPKQKELIEENMVDNCKHYIPEEY